MIPFVSRRSPIYVGTGGVATYEFAFKVFAKTDIAVRVTDTDNVEGALTLDTDYSVTLNADQDNFPGGSITLTAGDLELGYLLVILGDQDYSQTTQLPTGGAYNAIIVEQAMDRLMVAAQQLKEMSDRSLKFPSADATSSQLGTIAQRANKTLSFDDNGVPIFVATAADVQAAVDLALQYRNLAQDEAETAATERALAQTARGGAETAQAAAEAAAGAAMAAGWVYVSTAAGVAARANDDYFWVVSATNGAVLDLYRKVAGAAVSQNKSLISTEGVGFDSTISNALEVGKGSAGERYRDVAPDGTASYFDVVVDGGHSVKTMAADVTALTQALHRAIGSASLTADKMAARFSTTVYAAATNVFDADVDTDRPNYRLPVSVRTAPREYLVFCNAQGDTTDLAQVDIVFRKRIFNADGSVAYEGPIIALAEGGPDDGTGKKFQYSNVTALRTSSGKIIVWYTYRNQDALLHVPYMRTCPAGLDPENIANWTAQQDMSSVFPQAAGVPFTGDGATVAFVYPYKVLSQSEDLKVTVDGVTKTLTTDYTVSNVGDASGPTITFTAAPAVGAAILIRSWNALVFGPAKGIELQNGAHAGRIILPFWRSNHSYTSAGNTNGLMCGFGPYSDDDGVTWAQGAESWLSRSNESAVAEDTNGDVLLLVRREARPGKWVHRSRDGGAHIYETYQLDQDVVNAPVCESGFTQVANEFDGSASKIVMSGPRPSTAATGVTGNGRERPTIFLSYDKGDGAGREFQYRYEVGTGYCGYSCVDAFSEEACVLFWESDAARQEISAQVIPYSVFEEV